MLSKTSSTFRLDRSVNSDLERLARQEKVTKSEILRNALEKFLKDNSKKCY
ncbi:MAG: ribbon-helix-helix domain-containing protein [Spirirestis rafaelensis WJT71-NPBG6]|nr:ribbon-helix-helix domain-containing protein [Spirirestis rafaelensis WJT71-NPBG6]